MGKRELRTNEKTCPIATGIGFIEYSKRNEVF